MKVQKPQNVPWAVTRLAWFSFRVISHPSISALTTLVRCLALALEYGRVSWKVKEMGEKKQLPRNEHKPWLICEHAADTSHVLKSVFASQT